MMQWRTGSDPTGTWLYQAQVLPKFEIRGPQKWAGAETGRMLDSHQHFDVTCGWVWSACYICLAFFFMFVWGF